MSVSTFAKFDARPYVEKYANVNAALKYGFYAFLQMEKARTKS